MTPDLALLLAQMCVAELSLPARTGECVLQWHVQADLAERKGRSLETQVRLYTPIFKRKRNGKWFKGGPRRTWIRNLTTNEERPAGWPETLRWEEHAPAWLAVYAAEPAGWPSTLRWEEYAPSWLAVYAAAEAFLAGETLHPCPEADAYGGRCDDAVGACDPPKTCMAQVDCGDTAQAYWRVVPGCRPGSVVIPAGVAAGYQEHVEGG